MATIASGVIFLWPGTNASIPAGWTRETSLDTYYIQAAAAGADGDIVNVQGNLNHNHTSPSHTPVQNSHTHNVSAGNNTGTTLVEGTSSVISVAATPHTHTAQASSAATGTNNGIAITVNNNTNILAYIEVIFIKSNGTPTGVPNLAYGFIESDVFPVGWSRVHGDRYIKGAVALGNGGATAGSNSHSHTSPAHTHTQNGHVHAASASASSTVGQLVDQILSNKSVPSDPHSHSVTLATRTPTNNSVTTTIGSTNAEPVFKKLNLIASAVGVPNLPDGIVGLWGGTVAAIPTDWSRVTGMDGFFAKNANANGESTITTGGSLTHTHTASNCQPTQVTHNHTTTVVAASPTTAVDIVTSLALSVPSLAHTHTWTVTNTVATNQSTAVTINTSSSGAHYPQFKRPIFIKYTVPLDLFHATLSLLRVGF